jgi:membrane-bound lytic murein transglycosylase C
VETSDPKKSILSKPILLGQLTTPDNKPITKDNVAAVVKVAEIKETITPLPNNTGAEKVSITLALAPNHIKKRAEPFIQFVKTYSAQRGVDADHILGTIHTESFFNPAARSGCGALGLMQLMPQSGGAEAYAILKGKGMIPSAAYLYDPEKNIELGCIYIGMLESKYFGNVKSKNSRTFCSIAAYNTGPGNVAFTFTGKRKVDPAVMIINNMPDSVVYATMVEKLPFAETRGYLKMVYERMPLYR